MTEKSAAPESPAGSAAGAERGPAVRLGLLALVLAGGAAGAWLHFRSAAGHTSATVYRLSAERGVKSGKTFLDFGVVGEHVVTEAGLAGRLRDILDAGTNYEVRVADDFPYEYGLTIDRGGKTMQALFSPRDGKLLIVEDDPLAPDLRFLGRTAATDLAGILHSLVGAGDAPRR